MRVIVTGGGTLGHVYPALEIIKELEKHIKPGQVIWAGNQGSAEEKTALAHHIPFFALKTKKWLGQSLVNRFMAGLMLMVAIIQCLWFLLKHRPQAVIGVGGYVSAPMVLASFLLGIKRYIAEQNVSPGLVNTYLGKIAHGVFVSFAESFKYFAPKKTMLTGNPVRPEFFSLTRPPMKEGLRILITGGSQGARFINTNIPAVLQAIKQDCPNIEITHQTGQNMIDEVMKTYETKGLRAHVTPFIKDMPEAFNAHDLLISRAGATVIAEIMASGTPAILIPYPFALGHQKANAESLVKNQAAFMIQEGVDFSEHLATTLKSLYSDKSILVNMAQQARSMGIPHAARTMVHHILQDIKK